MVSLPTRFTGATSTSSPSSTLPGAVIPLSTPTPASTPRRKFVPPPPSYHSPQPSLRAMASHSPSAARRRVVDEHPDSELEDDVKHQDDSIDDSYGVSTYTPARHEYPPSASQSYKLSTPPKQRMLLDISPSSKSSMASFRQRAASTSTNAATAASPLKHAIHLGTRSPRPRHGQSPATPASSAGDGSPIAHSRRHRHTSSTASASSAITALPRALISRRHAAASGAAHDSDESWDDGELKPDSEYALPSWKRGGHAGLSNGAHDTGVTGKGLWDVPLPSSLPSPSPSPPKPPLLHENTLRGWTLESEPLPTKGSPETRSVALVRQFSDKVIPSVSSLSTSASSSFYKQGVKATSSYDSGLPLKLVKAHDESLPPAKPVGASVASSTGRGSLVLLSSRPGHHRQPSSLGSSVSSLTDFEPAPPSTSSALLPPFRTPPRRSLRLPQPDSESEGEERLFDEDDDLDRDERQPRSAHILSPPSKAGYSSPPSMQTRIVGGQAESLASRLIKKSSSGSLSGGEIANPTITPPSHQTVNLRSVLPTKAGRAATSPRALSFSGKLSGTFPFLTEETPQGRGSNPSGKVFISSLRKRIPGAEGLTMRERKGSSSSSSSSRSFGLDLSKKAHPIKALAPARPSTPPPFSDLITMPTPIVRQSKAERILGLSAGAATAIQASSAAAASSVTNLSAAPQDVRDKSTKVIKGDSPSYDAPAAPLTGSYTPHPYARQRAAFELLPRSTTPSGPAKKKRSLVKGALIGGGGNNSSKKEGLAATGDVSKMRSMASSETLCLPTPHLKYDPRRRPLAESALGSGPSFDSLATVQSTESSSGSGEASDGSKSSWPQAQALVVEAGREMAAPPTLQAPSSATVMSRRAVKQQAGDGLSKALGPGDANVIQSPESGRSPKVPTLAIEGRRMWHTPLSSSLSPPPTEPLPPLPHTPPPPPIEKDAWLVTEATPTQSTPSLKPATTVSTQGTRGFKGDGIGLTQYVLAKPDNTVLRVNGEDGLPIASSNGFLHFGGPCGRSVDSSTRSSMDDARPSSPELDASILKHHTTALMQYGSVKAEAISDHEEIVKVEESSCKSQSQAAQRATLTMKAHVLGTQLVEASELEDHQVYDSKDIKSRGRRTVVKLKVDQDLFWMTREALLDGVTQHPTTSLDPHLLTLVKTSGDMAEQLFGPDEASAEESDSSIDNLGDKDTDKAISQDTVELCLQDAFCSRSASRDPVSPSHLAVDLDNYLSAPDSPTSGSNGKSSRLMPSPILSPLSATSTIVCTPRTPVDLRASTTSTFARALGPFVAQHAAYVARLRNQQLEALGWPGLEDAAEDGSEAHSDAPETDDTVPRSRRLWSGGPMDVCLEEDDDNEAEQSCNGQQQDEDHQPGSYGAHMDRQGTSTTHSSPVIHRSTSLRSSPSSASARRTTLRHRRPSETIRAAVAAAGRQAHPLLALGSPRLGGHDDIPSITIDGNESEHEPPGRVGDPATVDSKPGTKTSPSDQASPLSQDERGQRGRPAVLSKARLASDRMHILITIQTQGLEPASLATLLDALVCRP